MLCFIILGVLVLNISSFWNYCKRINQYLTNYKKWLWGYLAIILLLNWPTLKKPILVTYNGMTNILKLCHEVFRSVSSLRLLAVGRGEGSLSTLLQTNARGQSASSHSISKVLHPLIYFLCLDKMTAAIRKPAQRKMHDVWYYTLFLRL